MPSRASRLTVAERREMQSVSRADVVLVADGGINVRFFGYPTHGGDACLYDHEEINARCLKGQSCEPLEHLEELFGDSATDVHFVITNACKFRLNSGMGCRRRDYTPDTDHMIYHKKVTFIGCVADKLCLKIKV